MPKVTVVIPAYNAMRYLPETMETALSQTYTDFEVLVVNDGSTDHTAEWVSQLTDSRVRIVSQENKGLAGARNTGVANAKGEYIAFLDADDLWELTKLEKQVRCLDENPKVGLVYTWTALADQDGKSTGRVIKSHAEGDVWKELLEFNMVCCGSTPLIRRSCLEAVGLFAKDVTPSDDWEMWLRLASQFHFGVVKEPLIRYRQHASNSSKKSQVMLETSRTIIERTFASAPTDLLHLRNRSYGSIYLYLGWRAIENTDHQEARHFRQQACAHRPQLFFSPRCIRLGLAIALIRWFGPQSYSSAIALIYSLRRGISATSR
ncbi:MAG: glycosyltransferase family A protein [Coleofasciculaceae cyanobacterium]